MSEGYDPARCDLCGCADATVVLERSAPTLASDARIVDWTLCKIECVACGLVRNGVAVSAAALTAHYADEYTLAARALAAEPVVFTENGPPIRRSDALADWLLEHIGGTPTSVLEVGCGEGSLLLRFRERLPGIALKGLDVSPVAVAAARAHGLDVTVGSYADADGDYDLIYTVAVIEHVPSPRAFLRRLNAQLAPGGRLVVIAPCLDRPTSELFFADHLHHFHSSQLEEAARLEGLHLVDIGLDNPALPGFVLASFVRNGGGRHRLVRRETRVREAVLEWDDRFRRVDEWLARDPGPIAVWGAGDSLALLLAYTGLEHGRISVAFEDNPGRFATNVPFPVQALEEAPAPVARVLLTFPPQRAARARLEALGVDWYSPFP
jgi:SAM-dependent methyltransferase